MAITIPSSVSNRLQTIEDDVQPIKDYEIGSRLSGLHQADGLTEAERKGAWAESAAFNFMAMGSDEQSVWGTHFGPVFRATRADGVEVEAPSIREIDADIVEHWERRAESTPHPVLRARYSDLVWDLQYPVSKQKPKVEFARLAIDSYVAIIERELYDEPVIGIRNAERALNIAIKIGDGARIERVKVAMFALHDQVAKPQLAGTWPFLFDGLYNNKKVPLTPKEEQKIIALLEEILRRTSDRNDKEAFSPWAAKSAGERLATHYRRLGSRNDVERVVRAYGGAFESISAEADAMLGMTWLHSVSEDYRAHGMTADAERAQIAGTEKGRLAPKEMKAVEFGITLDHAKIDAYLDALTEGSYEEVLLRIAVHFVPKVAEARESLAHIEKEHPLLAHIGIERVSEGHISARAGSIHEDPDGRMFFQLAETMAFHGPFLAGALERSRERLGLSAETIVNHLFRSPVFEDVRRSLLLHGLEAYFRGDYLTAVHILVPQIEQALRVLVGLLGIPINKPHRSGIMQVKNLNDILREPAVLDLFGEDLSHYLLVFLADSRGHNVRNEVCHGLLPAEAFGQAMADRVLHCLLTMAVIQKK
jgi:hypothetical protein